MPYLGAKELKASDIRRFDVTGSTSATHTLTWTAPNEQSLVVTINGVKQHEDAYSVSGTTLTLTSALVSSDKLEVIGINDIGTTITPAQNSVDADKIADDAVTVAKMNDSAYLANRNMIINGNMLIAQRGTATVDPTTNGYPVDRWRAYTTTGSGHTVQRVSDSPAGFEYSLKWIIGTGASPAAGNLNICYQPIEGYNVSHLDFGTSDALSIVASFWVKSSITGNYGFSIQNGAINRGLPGQYTVNVANTWEKKSVTLAGDTTGTWLKTNGNGAYVTWDIGSGTNHEGTLNTWGAGNYKRVSGQVILIATSGATIQFAGVQLEIGTTATPFEYKTYGQELAACQRYFQLPGNWQAHSDTSTATAFKIMHSFPVTMRASPTIGTTGTPTCAKMNVNAGGPTTISVVPTANADGFNGNSFTTMATGAGSAAATNTPYIGIGGFTADAEL